MTKKQLLKFLEKTEFSVRNPNSSLLFLDFVFSRSYSYSGKVHGVFFSPILSYIISGESFYEIYLQEKIRQMAENVYRRYVKDENFLNKIFFATEKQVALLEKDYAAYQAKKKTGLKQEDYFRFLKSFIEKSREAWYYGAIGEDKGEVIEWKVVPAFARRHRLPIEEARRIISVLAHPDKPTIMNFGRKVFLDLCLYIIKSRKIDKSNKELLGSENIQSFLKKYLSRNFWIKTNFYNCQKITAESLLREAKKEIKKKGAAGIEKELLENKNNFRKISLEKKKILKQFKFSSTDKRDLKFALAVSEWIDWRKEWMMITCFYFFSLFSDIGRYFGLNYKDITSYQVEELFELLEKNKKLSKKEITERNKKGVFVVFAKDKSPQLFYGKEAQELLTVVKNKNIGELKGVVASNSGLSKTWGRVSVVRNARKDKFKTGDILVASMTRTEFLPMMRQAKAIITSEGGIACHAAIVSRELGLPAIIGTKTAMQKLKTGDMVEMDLKSGVIKILK